MKTRTEITVEMDRVIVVKRRRKQLASAVDTSDLRELADMLRAEQAAEPSSPPEPMRATPCHPRPLYFDQSKSS